MISLHPEIIIDDQRHNKSVILSFPEWKKIVEELEELEDIRSFDSSKSSSEKSIPFEQAVREINESYDK